MDSEKKPLVLFGVNSVLEKLKASPEEVTEILLPQGRTRLALHAIADRAKALGVSVRYLDPDALDRIAGHGKHQGVLAKVHPVVYYSLADLLGQLSFASGGDAILFLDGLTDPRNFGALLRTAEAVGIRHVVIGKDRSVAVTPTVVKASAGAVHYLRIYRVTNLRSAILELKKREYWIVGLDPEAKESIFGRTYPEKLAVVLGGEGAGIRPLIMRECDFRVSIPMRGRTASLNVAVAGAVFLYEVLKEKFQG